MTIGTIYRDEEKPENFIEGVDEWLPKSKDSMSAQGRRYLFEHRSHQRLVQLYLNECVRELMQRGVYHDEDKWNVHLFEPYAQVFDELNGATYGSDEYRAALRKIKVAVKTHIKSNRHHPEAHEKGVEDMDLLDLMEMFCDWSAASRRGSGDGVVRMDIQAERFSMSPQLVRIFQNTLDHFKNGRYELESPYETTK